MFDLQRCKIAKVLAPISVAGGGNATVTEVDTKGFRAAACYIMTGLTGANGVTVVKWQESDTTGTGFTDITGAAHTALVDADDGIQLVTFLDLRGRKRFLQPVITTGSTNACLLAAYVILYRAEDAPDSASERGVQEQLFVPAL